MIPDFHDGYLEGLFVSGKTANIFLRMVTGQTYTLVLRGVERLHVDHFWEGNIILDLVFLQPEQLTQDAILGAYHTDEPWKGFVMQDWIQAAKRRGLQAIEISASYGCEAQILFQHYELLQGQAFLTGDGPEASK